MTIHVTEYFVKRGEILQEKGGIYCIYTYIYWGRNRNFIKNSAGVGDLTRIFWIFPPLDVLTQFTSSKKGEKERKGDSTLSCCFQVKKKNYIYISLTVYILQ